MSKEPTKLADSVPEKAAPVKPKTRGPDDDSDSDDDMVSYTGSLQKYTCCTHFPQCVTNCQILEIQLLTWQA